MRVGRWLIAVAGCVMCGSGCVSARPGKLFLQKVVRFGAVMPTKAGVLAPIRVDEMLRLNLKYLLLREKLAKELDRNVVIDVVAPSDLSNRFAMRTLDFAFVGPGEYETATRKEAAKPLLALTDLRGNLKVRGLFVVRRGSPIKSLSDLDGKSVAFGPRRHPVLHLAARDAIHKAGVADGQLGKVTYEQLFINPMGQLLEGRVDVAVVDSGQFDSLDPSSPEMQNTQVIGETTPILGQILLARSDADPKLVEAVKDWLLNTASKDSELLMALGSRGFEEVLGEDISVLRAVIQGKGAVSAASGPATQSGQ